MDRFNIRLEVRGRERTISIIDTENNDLVIKSVTVQRMPFSGGRSKQRTELENLCKELNKDILT